MLSEALHQPHFSIEKLGYLSPLQHFSPPLHSRQTSPTFLVFILFYCAGCCISHSVSCLSNQGSSWVGRSQLMLVSFSNKIPCSLLTANPKSYPKNPFQYICCVVLWNWECELLSVWYIGVFQDLLYVNFTDCLTKQQKPESPIQTLTISLGILGATKTG